MSETPTTQDSQDEGSVPAGEDTIETPVVKTESVDIAVLEKRFKDTQAELTRKSQALAEAEKALMETRLARLEATPRVAQPEVDSAAQRAHMIEILKEKGEEGVVDLIDTYARNLDEAISSKHKGAIEKAEARMQELSAEIERLRLSGDPLYQANKDRIEELKMDGLTEAQALKVLKRISPKPAIPAAQAAPAGTSGGRRDDDSRRMATEKEVAEYVEAMGGNVTAKEIEAFRKRGIRK